jgi:hypothetical protein
MPHRSNDSCCICYLGVSLPIQYGVVLSIASRWGKIVSSVSRPKCVLWLAFLSLLAGCTTASVLSNQAVNFNDATARAADAQLLLNIVRAAYRNPTRYTAISQLRDVRVTEGTFQASAQIPIGPDAARLFTLTPNAGYKANNSPSFDVVPLDNRASAQGLFRPVDPQVFYAYWTQGWPRHVLLPLFVDRIKINKEVQNYCKFQDLGDSYIDNSANTYTAFSRAQKIFQCIDRKMILEEKKKGGKEIISKKEISPRDLLKALASLPKDEYSITQEPEEGGGYTGRYTIKTKSKKVWGFTLPLNGKPRIVTFSGRRESSASDNEEEEEDPAVEFTMRSVDGMVFYLGELLRLQIRGEPPPLVRVSSTGRPAVLFQLHINADRDLGDRIEVEFLDKRFAIRREGGDADDQQDRTLTSFSLVSQLFSLYRESTDLPKTTAVQVVGPGQ